jgi:hypothetical protein
MAKKKKEKDSMMLTIGDNIDDGEWKEVEASK